jgi:ATP-dependent RNA helicase DBP3
MSTETEKKVKLSKEEKEARKAQKEAKRAKAAVDAPSTSAAAESTTPAEAIEGVSASSKKDKKNKDKKRKERDESGGEAIIRGEESGADKQQKVKDDKKKRKVENGEVAQPDPATAAAPTKTEATTLATPADAPSGLSKKQQKKLQRAAEAEAAAAAGPSSSAAEPLIKPESFTTAHNEYLATNAVKLIPELYPPRLDILSLPISDSLRPYLKKFTTPTPIQACSWPPLLASRDVVGIAETGSGKTLAFGVPGLNRLVSSGKKRKGPHMLVIAPTRELAQQSHSTLLELGKVAGISSICVFGGVGKDDQIRGIKDSKIVVGTPGRLLDLADSGDLDLSG